MNLSILHNLNRKEKIRIVQLLWDDIASDNSYTYVSSEHKNTLDERLNILENGKTKFKTLDEIELKFNSMKK
jgi:putative addiction module component (TIGR02574 family)